MKRKLRIPLAILLIACAAYAAVRIAQWKTEDDIREAVFRYQFAHNGSGLQARAKAYYLSTGPFGAGTSPRSPLLRRFKHDKPPVKPVAECTTDDGRVRNKRTGEEGVVFYIAEIRRTGHGRVTVYGGYYEANMSASGDVYTLIRKHGRWTVVHDMLLWIS